MSQKGSKLLDMMQELKRKYAAVETENEQLRQQLAAEQAKSAEWKFKFENMESCMLNMTVWKNQEKDRVNQAEATIAAMRNALEQSLYWCKDYVRYLLDENADGNWCSRNWQEEDIALIEQALSNTAGADHTKALDELKAERNKFQKELFELEDKYKQAYGWDKTANDTVVHLQAAEDRAKKLKEENDVLRQLFDDAMTTGFERWIVEKYRAVIGEGKA